MNTLKTTTALILTTSLFALPASASETLFSTDISNEVTEALVEQVIQVSDDLSHELEHSIRQSAEALWADLTAPLAENSDAQES